MSLPLEKWDDRFIKIAHEVASWSKDPRKQVGALLVSPDRRQVSWGYNGFPQGMDYDFLVQEGIITDTRDSKNAVTLHAEVNCILNSAVDVTDWTMYTTEPPCLHCASTIVQKRLYRLVCPVVKQNSNWLASQIGAFHLLTRARINITTYHGEDYGNRS